MELKTQTIGRQLIYRPTVTSTMNVAWTEVRFRYNDTHSTLPTS